MDSPHFTMSWDSFAKCVLQLKNLSDELQDEWAFHGKSDVENGAYISKKLRKDFPDTAGDDALRNFEDESNIGDEDIPRTGNTLLTFEYHVVYSTSYSCPVLCFNAWKMNGALLSLEECWQRLEFSDFEYKYNVLTQMDHPVLMRPFLTLHPCKTAELIGTSFEQSKNALVSWLSTVGPTVGLNILPEYAKLTF